MPTIPDPTTNGQSSRWSDRTLARAMGALFVATMLMGMVDAYLAAPILKGPLADIAAHRNLVMLGGLMRLSMSIGVVGIAISFYPVAKRFSETTAVSYLALRTAECVLLAIGTCSHVYLVALGASHALAGTAEAVFLSTQAAAALQFSNTTFQMAMTILGVSGMLQCRLLFRTGLVPRWISGLGLVGYFCLLASGLLDISGLVDTVKGNGSLLYAPGGLFEMFVLPAWLFWKGYATDSTEVRP